MTMNDYRIVTPHQMVEVRHKDDVTLDGELAAWWRDTDEHEPWRGLVKFFGPDGRPGYRWFVKDDIVGGPTP